MSSLKITTDRLDLIAGTQELAHANIHDRALFAALLNANVPDEWPPPLNDIDSMKWFERYLDEHPDGSDEGVIRYAVSRQEFETLYPPVQL